MCDVHTALPPSTAVGGALRAMLTMFKVRHTTTLYVMGHCGLNTGGHHSGAAAVLPLHCLHKSVPAAALQAGQTRATLHAPAADPHADMKHAPCIRLFAAEQGYLLMGAHAVFAVACAC